MLRAPCWPSPVFTLVVLSGLVIGFWSVPAPRESAAAGDAESPRNDRFTPAMLADRIEHAMQKYSSLEYTVEFSVRENTGAQWGAKPSEPIWHTFHGRYTYRGEGPRWFLDEDSYTWSVGDRHLTPQHLTSGFDGKRHFHFNSLLSKLVWGDNDFGQQRAQPRNIFWKAGVTSESLLAALRKPEAKVVRRELIDKHPCVVVEVLWIDDWDKSRTPRRLETTISPEQSFLPLKAVWERGGALEARAELRGLNQTSDGLWYPLMIRTSRPEKSPFGPLRIDRITSLKVRSAVSGNAFRCDEFQFEPPIGADVVDRRAGTAWHNDPWWSELAPWISEKFKWPQPDWFELVNLRNQGTFCDPKIAGQAAPAIEAAQWLNGDPGGWKREGRFITVLYFFGGDLIDPHPKLCAALQAWHAARRDDGIELIGIATSLTLDATKRNVEELGITFPVAMDRPSDRRGSFGKTFDAFQMRSYSGVLVVDPAGIVRLIEAGGGQTDRPTEALDDLVSALFEAAGKNPKFAAAPQPPMRADLASRRLSDPELQAIEAEWKRRAGLTAGQARMRGTITFAIADDDVDQPSDETAMVKAVPQLWLLTTNTPGGYFYATDRGRIAEIRCDDDGRFELGNLRKGTYSLVFTRPGFASAERKVWLSADDSEITADLALNFGDAIAGQVVDSDGLEVRGASVRATRRHLDPKHPNYWTTAHLPDGPIAVHSDGRFEFEGLYEGTYTFEVSAAGYEPLTLEMIKPGSRDLKVVLKKAARNK
ncbi:MAG TPA: carboxypeptidase regulatory-like domain-containing protein [Planctomycetaceae bacterium]|nr:carboxypeptidase regulatory-like domain-containing protein [Planctomycetaceae bacterium]